MALFHNALVAPGLVPTLGPHAFFNAGSLPTRPFTSNAGFDRTANLDLLGRSHSGEIDLSDDVTARSITA